MKKQERREKVERILLTVPRNIAAVWHDISKKLNRKIRDENHKIRKSAKVIMALLCVIVILSGNLISAYRKSEATKQQCASRIFYAMHNIVYELRHTMYTGEYTYSHSECVCKNLNTLGELVSIGEHQYATVFNRSSIRIYGTYDLTNAMGCAYTALHNYKPVASILYDGELSDNEFQFIEALYADLNAVYSLMLGPDELNRREDLRYEDIRKELNRFLQKWEDWSWSSDAPYHLLNQN